MSVAPEDDGFRIPEVGPWAKRKYHFLGRYLSAFTIAMREKWPQIHYIDLFCGAGFARIKGTGELVLASPFLAAETPHAFTMMHLCDAESENVRALEHRLNKHCPNRPHRIVHGDANGVIQSILSNVPRTGALCVTFADPFGLHLDFDTVRALASRRSDLIVLLADNMDALRNWEAYYIENPKSSLDRFLGESGWRETFQATPQERQAQVLRERYEAQLQSLGFRHFAHEPVQNTSGRDIYKLLFASGNEAGAKIWNGVSKVDEGGQRKLF
jgi:three-Cys-motif partner protein